MTTQEPEPHWSELLKFTRRHMGSIGMSRSEWTWVGGTVLMLRYQHRLSRDVDIFLNDPQLLSYLSPRLNDNVAAEIDGYQEQANHLRCFVDGVGEIDYLVAAPVIDFEPERMDIPKHGLLQGAGSDAELAGR